MLDLRAQRRKRAETRAKALRGFMVLYLQRRPSLARLVDTRLLIYKMINNLLE